ncbi:centromere protein I-like [Haliotis cracherodii]|uniref:centromere protein I-like n=1 Tax=Haliotis cracherodii TaxID=6455 RepID=UPI0039ED21AE
MSSPRKTRRKVELDDAVELISKCDSSTKVRGNLQLQLALDTIQDVAETEGLQPAQITTLLDKAASSVLVQTVSSRLIRCLIPRVFIPEKAVVKAVSWMCTNKPSTTIQSLLVRWVLLIYDHMDTHNKLHNLYGILFYFLENQTLFPYICHLLYQLTRKEDVKMFRVRRLLFLQNKYGSQPYIVGLLSLYKLYYPNLVSVPVSATRKIFFKSHDRKWAEVIKRVQEKALSEQGLSITVQESQLSKAGAGPGGGAAKRINTSAVMSRSKRRRIITPAVHSSSLDDNKQSDNVQLMIDHITVPFVRVNSFKEMLNQIDRIEFPSQIAAALQDPILQHVVAYSADQIVALRFSYWLQHTLIEEFFDLPRENRDEKQKFLDLLINFTDFLQEGIPVVDMFLQRFLLTWNGSDYRQHILRLISRCRIYPYGVLNDYILEPLRKLYFSSTVYFKCQVILTLVEMIKNYTAFEWPRYKDLMENESSVKGPTSSCMSIFQEHGGKFRPLQTLQDLIYFTDSLATLGLQLEEDNTLLANCVLDYVQLLSSLCQTYGVPFVALSPPSLLGRFLVDDSVLSVTRLCSIMCNYKGAFEALKSRQTPADLDQIDRDGTEDIQSFNRLLLDICNGLWRNRAFEATGSLVFDFNPSEFVSSVPRPNENFSIYLHHAFLGCSLAFLSETQPAGKKVHPGQIKAVKDYFLKFLEREHIKSIPQFIRTFIRKSQKNANSITESTQG